ncbi:uncharacterized protein LOC110819039 [Carica papaya]|uniref:uncharacterized protein LOC110819039 n=1 Tax=Carica papaya TaxID=3649 RepID=UPI000B8C9E6D|nr:uncharacterized protein LOC110819039 [Carica papaya]
MANALVSFPLPTQSPICCRSCSSSWFCSPLTPSKYPSKSFLAFSSSSSSPSSTSIVEDDPPPPNPVTTLSESATNDLDDLPFRGCKTCGREELERGCNGEGRIQGGIATVPGFGWWPIKAYRPCPGFVASGGRYRRRGQSMDEVAFGRGEKTTSIQTSDEDSSKKKQGPRKFKR